LGERDIVAIEGDCKKIRHTRQKISNARLVTIQNDVREVSARRRALLAAHVCGLSKQIFGPEKQDRMNWFWYLNQKVGRARRHAAPFSFQARREHSCRDAIGGPSSCFNNEQIRDNHFQLSTLRGRIQDRQYRGSERHIARKDCLPEL
jgi:hypothetical protein